MGKSMKLGGGGRFKKLAKEVHSKALAAYIGRKKYGKRMFAKMSHKAEIHEKSEGY